MRLLPTLTALIVLAGLVAVPAMQSRPAARPGWSEKAPVGEPRVEVASAFVNGKLYILGGLARGLESHSLNQEYDPATDRWRERAPMPGPLSHPNATTLDGKVYVVGGFLAQTHVGAQDVVYEYDPAADSWRMLAPLKVPRGSIGVAALNGKIHAVGGRTPDRVTSTAHEVYDPATNSWSDAAPLPKGRDHLSIAAANGRLHVIGGRFNTPNDNTDMHDVYDPATDTWTTAAPLPTPRSGGAAAIVRGQIIVAGGECRDRKTFVETEGFDLKSGRWVKHPPMPVGKHGITGASDGEVLYVAGGSSNCGLGFTDTLMVFRPR